VASTWALPLGPIGNLLGWLEKPYSFDVLVTLVVGALAEAAVGDLAGSAQVVPAS
jgi:hypothetical protein